MTTTSIRFRLADVFASQPYEGNGVAIFVDQLRLSTAALQAITVEVRQFESAYLWSTGDPHRFAARIFVVDQELAFAGHPALGAAAVLHERQRGDGHDVSEVAEWQLELENRSISLTSRFLSPGRYQATMDQGRPTFGEQVPSEFRDRVLEALSLAPADLYEDLPMQWASTGLRYLIVPVHENVLDRTRIRSGDFGDLLAEVGAQLAYVLDVVGLEGRNWINDGSVEDIATGSAAGPAAAYLVRHGLATSAKPVEISQGRFLNRPSLMSVQVAQSDGVITAVHLSGQVCLAGSGTLDTTP